MNQFCMPFFNDLELEYENYKTKPISILQKSNDINIFLKAKFKELDHWIENKEFENIQEEIHFFKVLKPSLVSKIILHKTLFSIESNLPPSKKDKRKFLEKELYKTNKLSKKHQMFYQYYRSNSTYNDSDYFVRSKQESLIHEDCILLNFNRKTSTSYDYIFAAFIANDSIADYIERKIEDLDNICSVNQTQFQSELQWTGTNLDFIELIYGLHHNKVVNGGNKEVKEIARTFCKAFNMDIEEQVYRYFIDIKRRKINKTRFLTSMTENLNKILDSEQ